ncbi:MAG TPA: Ig-like domain-containing protein, partial [Kofleriaceae bacterium]|nr:Ig-like domain-containing protein [Kofleriaceae bacterium]
SLAAAEEVHAVQTAVAATNSLRVIMDELLVGNSLEEIACRAQVDDDAYARVPLGATPDDIARCAVADDVLPSTCPASNKHSVCICQNDAGCQRGTMTIPRGLPVGVLDVNQDGAADDTRFINGAVSIQCGSITVPLDLDKSYWNPSGDQNVPAMGGFDALGPAIVLIPLGALPTNIACNLVFAADVVDKQGIAVCAPAGGLIEAGCTPGDTSAFTFGVEPLTIQPATFKDGDTGASRTDKPSFSTSAPVDEATLTGIQISPLPPGPFTISAPMGTSIVIDHGMTQLAPNTEYTVTFPVTITDKYARPFPQQKSYRFTTGA